MLFDTIHDGGGELPLQCGEYGLRQEIGRGAYGTVYLASAPGGGRVAVKVCRREDIGDERFERELRGAKLYRAIPPQEGLVRMLELAEEPWGFFAVMELADDEFGGPQEASAGYRPKTLASVIAGEKALPLGECVKLGVTLAKGLAALQRHHLLHRDIKPGNVIYVGGRPVLSDPGLVVEEAAAASLVGTPGYVPPESFTAASGDVYSLGLTLKAASFGRKVEDLDKGPALEADTGSRFFPAWWRILNKATDPTPSRRYQSAKALLKDFESLNRIIVVVGSPLFKVSIALLALIVLVVVWSLAASGGRSVSVQEVKEALLEDAIKNDPNLQRIRSGEFERDMDRQLEELNRVKKEIDWRQAEFAPKSTDNESDESDSK